jgi:nucleotide-binding universal stress UspA family protein
MTNSDPATILIAVDTEGGSSHAALAAANLFGEAASYRFAHVARPVPMTPPSAHGPEGVAPVGYAPVDADHDREAVIESAREVAAHAADDAHMVGATAVGLIGEPADALIDEAVACHASAIVVSAHDRGWVERLFHHSVRSDIERMSPVPVLVVPEPS